MSKKNSRKFLTLGVLALIAVTLVYAFLPQPVMVDIGEVSRGPMRVTIDEEGRTRVHDVYTVSTPVAGRLLRVDVQPGDAVIRGQTVVAQMLPTNPAVLDVRSREEARTAVTAAEAAVRLARAELNGAIADRDLADSELQRTRRLRDDAMVSQSVLDKAVREVRAAEARLGTAEASVAMSEAQLANARARLISFREAGLGGDNGAGKQDLIPVYAPASGRVLRVEQESETTLPVGTSIMEIGDIESDLEVLVELLSSDAVRVSVGDKVILQDWGGEGNLNGVIKRIDPWGFTKTSALGVEEQRVNTIIGFVDPPEARQSLGHGYRVEARIITWQNDDALIVPSSALFRNGQQWAVFLVRDGKAVLHQISIGRDNGIDAEVLDGLAVGDQVILYPSTDLVDGVAVEQRTVE
ncbi:MAG: HlyD family efflux transporter periplasmic adaptor subunit [Gammaproteobacteria bacterium]|nr:HlyD family efflux transporter periplasmic adaptor subunit [Gammaproteobacteria bacterium]